MEIEDFVEVVDRIQESLYAMREAEDQESDEYQRASEVYNDACSELKAMLDKFVDGARRVSDVKAGMESLKKLRRVLKNRHGDKLTYGVERVVQEAFGTLSERLNRFKAGRVEFVFPNAKYFRAILKLLSVFDNEVPLKVRGDGIYVRFLDPSRIALCDLMMEKYAFEEFRRRHNGLVAFNVDEVLKCLSRVTSETRVRMNIDGANQKLTLELYDGHASRIRRYECRLVEVEEDDYCDVKMKISFSCEYTLLSKTLRDDLKEMKNFNDHVTLEGSRRRLEITAMGAKFIYDASCEELVNVKLRRRAKASYSLSYLMDVIKPDVSEIVKLAFSTYNPLKIEYHVPFSGHLRIFIAPHIEE